MLHKTQKEYQRNNKENIMKITVAITLDTVERVYNLIEKIASMKMLYLWYMREMGKSTSRFWRVINVYSYKKYKRKGGKKLWIN